jgi:autotransporter-associated beta strand protein
MLRSEIGVLPATHARLQWLQRAAGAAVAVGTLTTACLGQTNTWVGPASGTFSSASNWQGAGPSGPGSTTTALIFTSGNTSAAVTATNDLGTPFLVNSLAFNVNNSFIVASSAAASKFRLDGTTPSITMGGVGTATMSATGGNIELAANATIGGAGPANVLILGAVTESGGAKSLRILGGGAARCLGIVQLGNGTTANTFTGGLVLDGGTVAPNGSGPQTFGATGSTLTVTPNGGTICANFGLSTGNGCSLGAIQLNGDLRFIGANPLPLTSTGNAPAVLQGSGSLILNTIQTTTGLTIVSNSPSYTGAVVIDLSELPQFTNGAGTLTLGSVAALDTTTNGALTGAASFDIRAGGLLALNNGTANTRQNGNRIGDSTPVTMRSGSFSLTGPALSGGAGFVPTDLAENIGTLSGAGACMVTVAPGSATGVTTTLNAASLARFEHGTFLFRAVGMGDTGIATRGNITFTSDPTGSLVGGGGDTGTNSISILPYAVGDVNVTTGNGTSFVTYGPSGLRPLALWEYAVDDLSGSTPTANVKVDIATDVPAATDVTVNSLVLATNGANTGSVTGSGTLHVTSGAIMCATTSTTVPGSIAPTINFGAAEGIIHATGSGGLTISGSMVGSNGLTKASTGQGNNTTLTLTGDNTGLTGPLTINSGIIAFNSAAALPGQGTIIVNGRELGGTAAGLTYSGSAPLSLGRPVAINAGFIVFRPVDATTGALTLDQQISGPGGMGLSAVASGPDIWVTNTANTYTGTTRISTGRNHIAADGSLGVGGGWEFAGATLVLEGDVTNSRHLNFTTSATIDTNGHNATFNGPMTAFTEQALTLAAGGGFSKNGLGTLTLTSPSNTVTGVINVNAGTLLVNGALGAHASNAVNVNNGGTLGGSGTVYRNVSVATGGKLAPSGRLTVSGSVTMASGSTLSMDLSGADAGTGYDQLVSSSSATSGATVALGSGTANLALSPLGFAPAAGSKLWLIVNSNAVTTTTGSFAGLPEGATVTLGAFGGATYTGTISYNGNFSTGLADHSGNDVVIYGIVGTSRCGSADFNCDGDIGTDADIESFFACLAGSCPSAPCTSNADFNGDGDVGTDTDIEAFFRVLAGGNC